MREFRGPRHQRGFIGAAASIVGAGAAVAGLGAASRNANSARAANDASARYYDWLANVGQQQWDIYQKNVIPQLQKLSATAPLDENLLSGQAADETKRQVDIGRQNLERALSTTRSPSDPGYSAALAAYQQGEAPAVSSAITASRNTTKQLNYERQLQAISAWQGVPQGTSAVATAAGGYGNVARTGIGINQSINQAAGQAVYGGISLAGALARRSGPSPAGPGGAPWNFNDYTGSMQPGANYPITPPPGNGSFFGGSPYNPDYRDGGAIRAYAGGAEYAPVSMFAEGGKIVGPGSGTSDSVSAIKKPGTYIIPADVVKSKGENYFDKMLEKYGIKAGRDTDDPNGRPVRLSAGEYAIPPHVVRSEGLDLFHNLLKKFHHPVEGDTAGLANGGAIRRRGLPSGVEQAIYQAMPTHILSRPRWAH